MLEILHKGINQGIEDTIFTDYYRHLSGIHASHEGYQNLPLEKWEWFSWHGFYSELQVLGVDGDWGYVANPRGGFTGFWWHWKTNGNNKQYYQLEHVKLCSKLKSRTLRSELS